MTVHAQVFLESVSCVTSARYLSHSMLFRSPAGFYILADLDYIVDCFDKSTKLRFRSSDEPQFIKFGGMRDNDPDSNIRFSQPKLLGSDVATFFEPSVQCIVKAVLEQHKVAHKPMYIGASHLFSLLTFWLKLAF